MGERDLALVLSGGGMNGLLLELGCLQRLREDPLWERVGWIYGTSAGALAGVMAAVDRLDALEEFVLALRPDESFRPNRLWQLPLTGLHDYALPETIAARLAPIEELARDVADAPIELVVCVTDVTEGPARTTPTTTPTCTRSSAFATSRASPWGTREPPAPPTQARAVPGRASRAGLPLTIVRGDPGRWRSIRASRPGSSGRSSRSERSSRSVASSRTRCASGERAPSGSSSPARGRASR